jgi:hypothetical protein
MFYFDRQDWVHGSFKLNTFRKINVGKPPNCDLWIYIRTPVKGGTNDFDLGFLKKPIPGVRKSFGRPEDHLRNSRSNHFFLNFLSFRKGIPIPGPEESERIFYTVRSEKVAVFKAGVENLIRGRRSALLAPNGVLGNLIVGK